MGIGIRTRGTRSTHMDAVAVTAATPATRDRYMDLLRVASLATVVLGHWLMAAVSVGADGTAGVGNLLAIRPGLQPLTWVLQVMPVFFFVGGFSHALSYRSVSRKLAGRGVYAAFLRARLQRLLRPTAVFVVVWGAGALIQQLTDSGGDLAGVAARLVAQPLWFIGIYLAMVAFTPPLLRLHERCGWWAFAGLVGAAAAVDVLRFAGGVPYVPFLNFAFVWLAVHQLGFLRADGKLTRPALLAVAGLAGAAVLVAFGPYPLSMVGMPGERISNMAPPTFALLCHGMWLVGAVELLRKPAARLLERPRAWRAVVVANGIAMTAFLWHLTAMLGVYAVMLAMRPRPPRAGQRGLVGPGAAPHGGRRRADGGAGCPLPPRRAPARRPPMRPRPPAGAVRWPRSGWPSPSSACSGCPSWASAGSWRVTPRS